MPEFEFRGTACAHISISPDCFRKREGKLKKLDLFGLKTPLGRNRPSGLRSGKERRLDQADIILRPEEPADHRQVEALTRAAFWNVNVPGCDEHYLAHVLRESPYFLPELDLVAELAGRVVGNIMYARALVRCGEQAHPALTFGPVSVLPEFQGRGIGRALIGTSLRLASELGHPAVMIYGDPNYYMRFGFIPAESFGIRTRDGMFSPALQALELVSGWLEGKSGRFEEPSVYDLDPEKAAEFDQEFPPREKLVTATQARFQELLSQSRF